MVFQRQQDEKKGQSGGKNQNHHNRMMTLYLANLPFGVGIVRSTFLYLGINANTADDGII